MLISLIASLVLTMHGALWVAVKGSGPVGAQALAVASRAHWLVCAVMLSMSVASFDLQPQLAEVFTVRPYLWVLALFGAAGLFGVRACLSMKLAGAAFLSSTVFIAALLGGAAFGSIQTRL